MLLSAGVGGARQGCAGNRVGPAYVHTWRLRLETEMQGDVLVVTASGRLGTASSAALIEHLVGAIDQGSRRLVLDLRAVDYVSSAGLLAFDAIAGRIYHAGGHLALCELSEPVALAFELAGLREHFVVESSRLDAIARVADTDE